MYSDLTHFVYELLQNADDYGATEVQFKLTATDVTVEHNGTPFTPENVFAITSFGESTSRDDMLKTGRFGVGFKSVFAFTATPIIVSGDEHFMIHGLYRVSEYPYPEDFPRGRTRIVLPFNHQIEKPDYVEDLMSAEEAYEKISARLTGLNMHTLLFTKSIREIRWEIDGASGHYLREDMVKGGSRHTTITDGQMLNKYLVFSRTPTWRGQAFKDVEIAFGLDRKDQITSIQDFLYVLFCTTQETHLQFILNGPYKTNPSRETISEEDSFNRHLMKETCQLLADTLPHLRDKGLLNTQFLGVLPNETDGLRPFYAPLLATVVERFQVDELVPTDDDRYAAARQVFQGPAALREIITPTELAFLGQAKMASWAKGVVQYTRPDNFLKALSIKQWGYQELQNALEARYGGRNYYMSYIPDAADVKWLEDRPDDWLQKLYMLLGDALGKEECDEWTIQHCRIVRVVENKAVNHVAGSKAYFPKGKSYRDLPQIKSAILRGKTKQQNKKIEDSLIALGVKQIGEEERIDLVLETYYGEDSAQVSRQQHLDHMRLFIKWWKKERSTTKFRGKPIFRIAGSEEMQSPDSCYLDTPLKSTGLGVIYRQSRQGISQKHKLWSRYREINSEGFCDFAVACGVAASLPIERQSCYYHPKQDVLRQDYNRYGTRFTNTGIDVDFNIPGLKALLRLQEIEINALVWDTLRKADPEVLEAQYRPNRTYATQNAKSSLVLTLAAAAWIPDAGNVFRKPADITRESLHPSFSYDDRNGWLIAIGFAEKARRATAEYRQKQEFARALGLDMELVDLLNGLPPEEQNESLAQITAMLRRRARAKAQALSNQQTSIPFHEALSDTFTQGNGHMSSGSMTETSGTARNPDRRQAKLEAEVSQDIENEPSPDTRFTFGVCKKWKGKNDVVRQNLIHWYEGKCQICERTFLQRNSEPYFEGLYLVPYTKAEWIDRPGNVLCLCPWHSAMLQFGTKAADTDILSNIEAYVPSSKGGSARPAITLTLCGESATIVFHEDHFLELQVMIRESRKASRR
ncbi:MAG: hypothetical protein IT365_01900 [Candidatus Hydrogenedentes bacterium]|nr:hypothetical protein [Candidatus Hydrogenedentota bacterium]